MCRSSPLRAISSDCPLYPGACKSLATHLFTRPKGTSARRGKLLHQQYFGIIIAHTISNANKIIPGLSMKKYISSLFFAIALFIPVLSAAVIQDIHIELTFDVPADKTVQKYRIYQEGTEVCSQDVDQAANTITIDSCKFDSPNGTFNFTSTALYTDNTESPHSPQFSFTLDQQPSASFSTSPQVLTATVPFTVTVNPANSKGHLPDNNHWNFGDANVITGSGSQTHTYTIPGTYEITLTVSNESNTTDQASVTVTATSSADDSPAPVARIESSTAIGGTPLTVDFDGSKSTTESGTIQSHQWSFGDGSATSSLAAPQHIFTIPGTYTTSLTVTNSLGKSNTTTTPILVTSALPSTTDLPPIAQATATQCIGCAPIQVSFDASGSHDPESSLLSYDWQFGDGDSSTAVIATHHYTIPGTYTVILTVSDRAGNTANKKIPLRILEPGTTFQQNNLIPIYLLLLQ